MLKMTPRENLLSLYRRRGYEYAPAYACLCPEQERVFFEKTGKRDVCEFYPVPFRNISNMKMLGAERSEWMKYYSGGLKEGARISAWGVAHESGNSADSKHFTHMRHPLAGDITMDDLVSYPFPKLTDYNKELQREEALEIKGAGLAVCGSNECTIWETAWYMRGMEDLMVDMLTGDEKAAFLLDTVTDTAVKKVEAFARAGVDILQLGDDIGTQHSIMMSVELYREWLKPRLAKVIKAAKEINPDILVQYHSCGYVEPFINDLIDVGVDILNPVQPESMRFKDIFEKYGDRLSFNGTLGTQTTMPFGTPEDVRKSVFEALDIAGEKGGLFCCPTHVVEPEVPWENIEAYFAACSEYR